LKQVVEDLTHDGALQCSVGLQLFLEPAD
jgi:hypothetical protein